MDRVDTLVLGNATAAQHRVSRLLDPAAAAIYRRAQFKMIEGGAEGAVGGPTHRVKAARASIQALLAPATPAAGKAA
jgi:hypothetical protein